MKTTLILALLLSPAVWSELVPPYIIGGVAMFWVIQRIAAF